MMMNDAAVSDLRLHGKVHRGHGARVQRHVGRGGDLKVKKYLKIK